MTCQLVKQGMGFLYRPLCLSSLPVAGQCHCPGWSWVAERTGWSALWPESWADSRSCPRAADWRRCGSRSWARKMKNLSMWFRGFLLKEMGLNVTGDKKRYDKSFYGVLIRITVTLRYTHVTRNTFLGNHLDFQFYIICMINTFNLLSHPFPLL